MFLKTSLNLNSLVHLVGEVGKVMSEQCQLNIRVKSITELSLPMSISCNVFFSITRQVYKFPLISIYSIVALGELRKSHFFLSMIS